MNTILESDRLSLDRVSPSHVEALTRLVFADPEVMKHSDSGVLDEKGVLEWIAKVEQSYQENGFGPMLVVEKATGELIGYCGLSTHIIDKQPEVEIGYRIGRSAQGRGYATEAARAVLDYAKSDLHIPRVVALIEPDNTPSIGVAEKLNMTHERDVMLPGYDHPDYLYSVEL